MTDPIGRKPLQQYKRRRKKTASISLSLKSNHMHACIWIILKIPYPSSDLKNFVAEWVELLCLPYKVIQVLCPTVYQLTSRMCDLIPKVYLRFLKIPFINFDCQGNPNICFEPIPNIDLFPFMAESLPTTYVNTQEGNDHNGFISGENKRLLVAPSSLRCCSNTITPVFDKHLVIHFLLDLPLSVINPRVLDTYLPAYNFPVGKASPQDSTFSPTPKFWQRKIYSSPNENS